MAIDESTDATDMTPLAIIIRGTDNEYNVTEEMASLVPLKDTTKSLDLYEAVKKKKNTSKGFYLTFIHIFGIATDGALMVVGKKKRGWENFKGDDAITTDNSGLM